MSYLGRGHFGRYVYNLNRRHEVLKPERLFTQISLDHFIKLLNQFLLFSSDASISFLDEPQESECYNTFKKELETMLDGVEKRKQYLAYIIVLLEFGEIKTKYSRKRGIDELKHYKEIDVPKFPFSIVVVKKQEQDTKDYFLVTNLCAGNPGASGVAKICYKIDLTAPIVFKFDKPYVYRVEELARDIKINAVQSEAAQILYDGEYYTGATRESSKQVNGEIIQTNKHCEVLPMLPGITLYEFLRKNPTITKFDCHQIALSLAEALKKLHDQKIAHFDLHGNNVLVSRAPDGAWSVSIIDPGMAKKFGDALSHTVIHRLYEHPLYPHDYISKTVDARIDLHQMAILFVELFVRAKLLRSLNLLTPCYIGWAAALNEAMNFSIEKVKEIFLPFTSLNSQQVFQNIDSLIVMLKDLGKSSTFKPSISRRKQYNMGLVNLPAASSIHYDIPHLPILLGRVKRLQA